MLMNVASPAWANAANDEVMSERMPESESLSAEESKADTLYEEEETQLQTTSDSEIEEFLVPILDNDNQENTESSNEGSSDDVLTDDPASVATVKVAREAGNIRSVSLGTMNGGAITTSGNLYMWGTNRYGQLGNGELVSNTVNAPIGIMKNVEMIDVGNDYTAAITTNGNLYMWGCNVCTRIGPWEWNEEMSFSAILLPKKVMANVKAVSLGGGHSAAITTDGSLYTWGYNNYGQLGDGTTEDSSTPVKIMDNVRMVSLGTEHSAAITTDGSLYMWGLNNYGQLGNGLTENSSVPIKVMDNVKMISLGNYHGGGSYSDLTMRNHFSAAIATDGSLYMWGSNEFGQLGNSTTESSSVPIKIMDNVKEVSLGEYHSGAITNNGSLYMWGENWDAQLGDGTRNDSSTPIKIMEDVEIISLGSDHSAAITTDGNLYTWGNGSFGMLGDGKRGMVYTPTHVKIGSEDDNLEDPEDNTNIPIIIVPGIMGSNLYTSSGYKIWGPNVSSLYVFPAATAGQLDLSTNPVLYCRNDSLNLNTASKLEYGVNNTYKALIDDLCSEFPEREIYFCSYDWRQSNSDSADKLASQIKSILMNSEYNKVDVIAHSMGGLVTSEYINKYGDKNVNKIVTGGTPYEGAPLLLNRALGRKATGTIIDNCMYLLGLNVEIKTQFSSLAELIPTKEYYASFKWKDNSGKEMPYSEFSKVCNSIFGNRYSAATNFHDEIKIESDERSQKVNNLYFYDNAYFIVGKRQATVRTGTLSKKILGTGYTTKKLMYELGGDGTVPYASATMMGALTFLESKGRYVELETDHDGTVNSKKARQYIKNILANKVQTVKSDEDKEDIKRVGITVACPVDVEISKNGETLSSSDNNLTISTSFGSLEFCGDDGDIKEVYLEEGVYDVILSGYDTGEMDFTIYHYDENGDCTATKEFLNIPLTSNTLMTTTVDSSNQTILNVDSNGDGVLDQKWTVSNSGTAKVENVSNTSTKPSDTTKPSTYTLTFNPNSGKVSTTKKSVTKGQTYGTLPIPTRSKYTFKGWYTAKSGGTKIIPSTKVNLTKNQTIYAQWDKVVVKKTKINKLANMKGKKVKINIKKVSGADGYQIVYSTSKKFKKSAKKTTTKKTYTLKKLKKGRTYYVKVRAYKKDSTGAKVYGKYSAKKKVTIKK